MVGVGEQPSADGSKIAFETREYQLGQDLNSDGDSLDLVIRVYDTTTSTITNTGELGLWSDISGDIVVFSTYESVYGSDLNGDMDTNDIVVRYYDLSTSTVHNTGADGYLPSIDGDIIAFRTNENDVGQDLNSDGDQSDYIVRYHRISTSTTTNTTYDGQKVSVDGDLIAFTTPEGAVGSDLSGDGDQNDDVVRYYSISTTAITNTGTPRGGGGLSPFGEDPTISGNIISIGTAEGAVSTDLNSDGDQNDVVVQYFDKSSSSTTNVAVSGLSPWVHDDIIAFTTYEQSDGVDLNNDGDQNDYILRYYSISGAAVTNTGEIATYYTSGTYPCNPSVSSKLIAFSTYEAWSVDMNGDGDQTDNIIRYIKLSDPRPAIRSIVDVGNDQGRQVRIRWTAALLDSAGSSTPITEYSIFRRDDALPKGYPPGDWDFVKTVPAYAETVYSTVVPTLADSTIANGMHWSVFFVRAATATPAVYYDSPIDSGYSIDNLAPCPPGSLKLAESKSSLVSLTWDECPDEDFNYFAVYRREEGGSYGSPIGYTCGTSYDDSNFNPGVVNYYVVTAFDFSGNESDQSNEVSTSATGLRELDGGVHQFWLVRSSPNPMTESTRIPFSLKAAGEARLSVFDLQGRLVADLFEGKLSQGRYEATWNGRDMNGSPVASGIYFFKLRAGDLEAVDKVMMIR
jgi:hypothetical protein